MEKVKLSDKEKKWKPFPQSCPDCGCETLQVLSKSVRPNYFYDREEVKCTNPKCKFTDTIIVEYGDAQLQSDFNNS